MRNRHPALLFGSCLSVAILAAGCGGSPDQSGTSAPGAGATSSSVAAPTPLPDRAFKVEWIKTTTPPSMEPGGRQLISVTFRNLSADTWPDPKSSSRQPPGAGAVRLSYRWWTPGSPLASPYAIRSDLQAPLRPGDTATLSILVTAPTKRGEYKLQFDLVQELVAWFEEKGARRLTVPVAVRE